MSEQVARVAEAESPGRHTARRRWRGGWRGAIADRAAGTAESGVLRRLVTPLALPWVAGLVALAVYLLRAALAPRGLQVSRFAYFNYLADAFLHGQLHLRLPAASTNDLVFYGERVYLYWPPFPAILVLPLVALFGVGVSDVLYTVAVGALSVALLAWVLALLDRTGIAPLSAERRAILVATGAFGTVLLILAAGGSVWFTSQVVGYACALTAVAAALAARGKVGYVLAGLALACAAATRVGLLFHGVWLAYYLLRRDRHLPPRERLIRATWGLTPVAATLLLLGWYNLARFGSPLDMGLAWHQMHEGFHPDFYRHGVFSLHYLPANLYYHFLAPPFTSVQRGLGGGIFGLTPLLLGGVYAVWRDRRCPLTWALVLSGALVYAPIGLLMGIGYYFGPRYLLDLLPLLLVLTARGVRRWRLGVLQLLMIASCAIYVYLSVLYLLLSYYAASLR